MKAIVIKTDNTVIIKDIEGDTPGGEYKVYDFLKEELDGWVEHVCIMRNVFTAERGTRNRIPYASMYVNEEGKLLNLPINRVATYLYTTDSNNFDFIAGDAVVLGLEDEHGNDTSVTSEMIEYVMFAATHILTQ